MLIGYQFKSKYILYISNPTNDTQLIHYYTYIFFYRLDRWFSRLNGFNFLGPLCSLMFGVSQSSVLKAVPWPIMVYFHCYLDGELLHWHSYTIFLYLYVRRLNLIKTKQQPYQTQHVYNILYVVIEFRLQETRSSVLLELNSWNY